MIAEALGAQSARAETTAASKRKLRSRRPLGFSRNANITGKVVRQHSFAGIKKHRPEFLLVKGGKWTDESCDSKEESTDFTNLTNQNRREFRTLPTCQNSAIQAYKIRDF